MARPADASDDRAMNTVEASATTSATRSQVWRLIADESLWPVWGRWSSVEIEGGGAHGLGAVRRLVQRPFTVRERVTEWLPDERMSYELLDGMHARGYRATASLEDAPGGGTIVRWSSTVGVGRPDHGLPAAYGRQGHRKATRQSRGSLAQDALPHDARRLHSGAVECLQGSSEG